MNISEDQLEVYAKLGATVGSANTYESIKNALLSYSWPSYINHIIYLQGSYANSTNIRGNSDVDVVIETEWVFYSNLTEVEKQHLNLLDASYTWHEFRNEVVNALVSYYGANQVDSTKNKSIKLRKNSNRLPADIIPCASYRKYSTQFNYVSGITFRTMDTNTQIINYPKLHKASGIDKNNEYNTKGWFKPTVRIFKNIKERIIENNSLLKGKYPSYFVENLVYNIPNHLFGNSYLKTIVYSLEYLIDSYNNDSWDDYICQNKQEKLFGYSTTQWNKDDAFSLISEMINFIK